MGEIVFIDANIFLELALENEKSSDCQQFFYNLNNSSTMGITTDFIIYTSLLQIYRKLHSQDRMKRFLTILDNMPRLEIIRPTLYEMALAIDYMARYKLDFDDALVVSCATYNKIQTIVSFDKDFDKVKEIKRIEP